MDARALHKAVTHGRMERQGEGSSGVGRLGLAADTPIVVCHVSTSKRERERARERQHRQTETRTLVFWLAIREQSDQQMLREEQHDMVLDAYRAGAGTRMLYVRAIRIQPGRSLKSIPRWHPSDPSLISGCFRTFFFKTTPLNPSPGHWWTPRLFWSCMLSGVPLPPPCRTRFGRNSVFVVWLLLGRRRFSCDVKAVKFYLQGHGRSLEVS